MDGSATLEKNVIRDCKSVGVSVIGITTHDAVFGARPTSGCLLNNNRIINCGSFGVWVRRQGNAILENNEISGCVGAGVTVDDIDSKAECHGYVFVALSSLVRSSLPCV